MNVQRGEKAYFYTDRGIYKFPVKEKMSHGPAFIQGLQNIKEDSVWKVRNLRNEVQ